MACPPHPRGGYVPASDLHQITGDAQNIAKSRDGGLSLGLDLDVGMLRGTLAYASGTTIKDASHQGIGKADVLATTADVVIRPVPRFLMQPYLIVGGGEKFFKYRESRCVQTVGSDPFLLDACLAALSANGSSPTLVDGPDTRAFALHGGVGADIMLGNVGVAAELTDFVSKGVDSNWNAHDAFLMVGLKWRLGR